jgi:hypothetical protein
MRPELVRTVQMGPWQHKVDDGLEARKTAYETLYTLVRPAVRPGSAYRRSYNNIKTAGHVLDET